MSEVEPLIDPGIFKLTTFAIMIGLMLAAWLLPDKSASRMLMGTAILLGGFSALLIQASPNTDDNLAGYVIGGFAAVIFGLAISDYLIWGRRLFIGTLAVVIAAYSLPASFWNAVGLGPDSDAGATGES